MTTLATLYRRTPEEGVKKEIPISAITPNRDINIGYTHTEIRTIENILSKGLPYSLCILASVNDVRNSQLEKEREGGRVNIYDYLGNQIKRDMPLDFYVVGRGFGFAVTYQDHSPILDHNEGAILKFLDGETSKFSHSIATLGPNVNLTNEDALERMKTFYDTIRYPEILKN